MFAHPLNNAQLLSELDKEVYGHKQAKIALINCINRGFLRWNQEFNLKETENLLPLKNVLLVGGSGTGKTFLIERLQHLCGFIMYRIDATQILPSGATAGGDNVKNIVEKIVKIAANESEASGKIFSTSECMRKIIVFVDEIDKLCNSYESSGKWNKHVQSNLLQLVEEKTELKGVTFIFAGAFQDMLEGMVKTNKQIGFSQLKEKENTDEIDWSEQVIKAGLIPELIGRISSVVKLDALEKSDYRKILVNYLLPKYQLYLRHYGIHNFKLNSKTKEEIINKVIKSQQGVRFLKRELEKIIEELEFNYEDNLITFTNYLEAP